MSRKPNKNNDGLGRTVVALLVLVLAYFLLPTLLQLAGMAGGEAGREVWERQEQGRAERANK